MSIDTAPEHGRQLAERLAALRDTGGYRAYEQAREHFLRMKDLEAGRQADAGRPSAYWREELDGFEYLLDASPLIVDKLRHHTYHVTGLRTYDYRSNQDKRRLRFARKLDALIEAAGSRDLLVAEHPAVGGFGHEIDGQIYNLDTLKFFEVLTVLERGAVLPEFRGGAERRLVWEIGAGWGGFPYQFKTLCPNVTYVITDLPELFLFSATYLATVFPNARMRFFGDVPIEQLFDGWQAFDFIFLPNTFHDAVRPERVDLVINMVSFQEMTTSQVHGYVRQAYDWNCPFLYSLNRDRSPHNTELSGVWELVDRYYWSREYRILPVSYQKMLDEEPGPPDREYKHVVGWRRMTTE
jgi:putative sugar O-methyltransferase